MNESSRRGVTRGYVGGLIVAALIVAAALTVGGWGLISLGMDRDPVTVTTRSYVAPLIVVVALGALAWGLWLQALTLLRGRKSPSWGHVVVLAGAAYLIWFLGGVIAGLSVDDTIVSPFAGWLALVWALVSLLFWAVLARRVYTDRPTPKWPWERDGESE